MLHRRRAGIVANEKHDPVVFSHDSVAKCVFGSVECRIDFDCVRTNNGDRIPETLLISQVSGPHAIRPAIMRNMSLLY